MAGSHSTGVDRPYHNELMGSVEARSERRAQKLAALPIFIGRALRGYTREGGNAALPPYNIPENLIIDLGKRLDGGPILRDKFTEKLPVLKSKDQYERYVTGGNKHNRRKETDPEEKHQARIARIRQTQHVSDRLHEETWKQWQLARLFKASVMHVKLSLQTGQPPRQDALVTAAAALEDFGYCLEGEERLKTLHNGGILPGRIKQAGIYGATHPESLQAQPPTLFLLVQREQERREELWGDNLDMYEQHDWGGKRRTRADLRDEAANDELITGWQVE
jgi:hypothetical protein